MYAKWFNALRDSEITANRCKQISSIFDYFGVGVPLFGLNISSTTLSDIFGVLKSKKK